MRALQATGDRIIVAAIEGSDQTDGGIYLARTIEEPYGYVLSVGPLAGAGAALVRAVDHMLAVNEVLTADAQQGQGATDGPQADAAQLHEAIEAIRAVRHSGPGVRPGDLVLWRRDLSIEFEWCGEFRLASIRSADVLAVVEDTGREWILLDAEADCCPHGGVVGECAPCDVVADLAHDADREARGTL